MLPLWADVLIVCALPVILLTILWKWGAEEPDNSVVHQQEDEPLDPDRAEARVAA